jgi:hypothetical protein
MQYTSERALSQWPARPHPECYRGEIPTKGKMSGELVSLCHNWAKHGSRTP